MADWVVGVSQSVVAASTCPVSGVSSPLIRMRNDAADVGTTVVVTMDYFVEFAERS